MYMVDLLYLKIKVMNKKELEERGNCLEKTASAKRDSREKSIALTKIEQARLWLNAIENEKDFRRLALARTNFDEANLWLNTI